MTVTKVVEGCVYIRRRYYGILPRVGGGGGNFLLVVHGKEEKKKKGKSFKILRRRFKRR